MTEGRGCQVCIAWQVASATQQAGDAGDRTAEALDQVRYSWPSACPCAICCGCPLAWHALRCDSVQGVALIWQHNGLGGHATFCCHRLEAVERLILESQQRYPNNLDAGIEYAMREMHDIIADAEHGNAEAVAEVGCLHQSW